MIFSDEVAIEYYFVIDFILIVTVLFFQIIGIFHIDLIDLKFVTKAPIVVVAIALFKDYYCCYYFKIIQVIIKANFNFSLFINLSYFIF